MRKKSKAVLCSLLLLGLTLFPAGRAIFGQASTPAEVKSDALPVYSDMSTSSDVVTTLKKGDLLSIHFRVNVTGAAWCRVALRDQTDSLGYVLCKDLAIKEPGRQKAAQSSPPSTAEAITGAPGKQAASPPRTGSFITSFNQEALRPVRRDPNVTYNLDPRAERFFVYVPANYSGQTKYGLVVFLDAGDEVNAPPNGWASVLDAKNLLFIAPEKVGNQQHVPRRLGMGVLAALEMMKNYEIDAGRVYVSGFSGGARMAGMLGFFQSDVFRGTVQNCGADFYQHVPQVDAKTELDTAGQPYGFFDATAEEVRGARSVRFALITGSQDFRRGNILDVYNGGFARDGFQAKLFDVAGMGHDTADRDTFSDALDFLEAGH